MAFQPVPFTFEINCNYLYRAVPIQMTFHVEVASPDYTVTALQSLCDAAQVWQAAQLLQGFPSDAVFNGVEGRGLANQNDIFASNTDDIGEPGLRTNIFPNMVAFAIKRTSGLTGRSARGRVYWPAASQDQNSGNENQIDAGRAALYVGALGLFEDAMQGAVPSAIEVITSRVSSGSSRPVGVNFPVVGYAYTNLQWDTMRERMP